MVVVIISPRVTAALGESRCKYSETYNCNLLFQIKRTIVESNQLKMNDVRAAWAQFLLSSPHVLANASGSFTTLSQRLSMIVFEFHVHVIPETERQKRRQKQKNSITFHFEDRLTFSDPF